MAQPPKGGLVRGHDTPIHRGCAIYFPGGVNLEPEPTALIQRKKSNLRGVQKTQFLETLSIFFQKKKSLQGTRDPETNMTFSHLKPWMVGIRLFMACWDGLFSRSFQGVPRRWSFVGAEFLGSHRKHHMEPENIVPGKGKNNILETIGWRFYVKLQGSIPMHLSI